MSPHSTSPPVCHAVPRVASGGALAPASAAACTILTTRCVNSVPEYLGVQCRSPWARDCTRVRPHWPTTRATVGWVTTTFGVGPGVGKQARCRGLAEALRSAHCRERVHDACVCFLVLGRDSNVCTLSIVV